MRNLFLVAITAVIFVNGVHGQCPCANDSNEQGESKFIAECSVGTYLPEELQTPIFNSGFLNNGVTTGQVEALMERFRSKFPDVTFTYVESKIEVNAVAFGDGVTFPRNVELWGGMAKHPAMRLEGLAIILAHEVGHHYGNTDKVVTSPTTDSDQKRYSHGAYCEDQSDFWGTRVGLRIVYNNLSPFTNANMAGAPAYDWSAVDNADSEEFEQKVQPGIDQAFSLLSGGLFVPAQAYLKTVNNPSTNFASSGCGHPQAGCRKALYESGKNKGARATCNDALEFFAGSTQPETNAAYIFKKFDGKVELKHYGHGDRPSRPQEGRVNFSNLGQPSDSDLIKGLLEEIKEMKAELTEIKSKLDK